MKKLYVCMSSYFGMLLWLFVGFLVWIPLLLLETSKYCYDIILSTVNGTSMSPNTVNSLKNKIGMYYRGFKNLKSVIITYSARYDHN